MKLTIIAIKFLFVGALFIVSNNQLYLSDSHDLNQFYDMYHLWLSNVFDNVKQLTSYVVKSEWLPEETINKANSLLVPLIYVDR
ncbi:hypothetical protein J4408_01070 [Candidatus Pacearchaeota archaeon]|nr:hypothetical protein [Candidatus Pacearchaeota archaeon]